MKLFNRLFKKEETVCDEDAQQETIDWIEECLKARASTKDISEDEEEIVFQKTVVVTFRYNELNFEEMKEYSKLLFVGIHMPYRLIDIERVYLSEEEFKKLHGLKKEDNNIRWLWDPIFLKLTLGYIRKKQS